METIIDMTMYKTRIAIFTSLFILFLALVLFVLFKKKTENSIDVTSVITSELLTTQSTIMTASIPRNEYIGSSIPLFVEWGGTTTINENLYHISLEDMPYIDNDMFQTIKEAYSAIDFYGEFEIGDIDLYDSYKAQYLRLLKCEIKFYDKYSRSEFYLNEFREMKTFADEIFDLNEYKYYYFDMDGDDSPELCISDESRFTYIFKYIPNTGNIILWRELFENGISILATKKLWRYNLLAPATIFFICLNQLGEIDYEICFYGEGYYNHDKGQEDEILAVTLPEYTDKSKNVILSEKAKNFATRVDFLDEYFYYRVTREQWDELTRDYYASRALSQEKIKKVRYSFNELFNK